MLGKTTLALLLVSGCVTDNSTPDADGVSQPLAIESCPGRASDSFTLGELSIRNSVLHAQVLGGGGCRSHTFSVCWSGAVADSYPAQASLELAYHAHGDPCDAIVTHDVQIDLTSLPAWVERPLVFHITGAAGQLPDTTNSVKFE